jgi:hypothetical protein
MVMGPLQWAFGKFQAGVLPKICNSHNQPAKEKQQLAAERSPDHTGLQQALSIPVFRGNIVFFFCSTGVWTQGLTLARQTLYHLYHSTSLFFLWWVFSR